MNSDTTKEENLTRESGVNKKILCVKALAFVLVTVIMLQALSWMSCICCQKANPDSSVMTASLWEEPDQSIEVLAIGSSNVYSAVCPLEWWEDYGYTGFSWGEAAQRMGETYAYLTLIYQHQTPRVVFIDMTTVYRDQSITDNLNSTVKGFAEAAFPIFSYHRFLSHPDRLTELTKGINSTTKGYLIRDGVQAVKEEDSDDKDTASDAEISGFAAWELKRMIKLCRRHGSEVVLMYIPSPKDWNEAKYQEIRQLADSLETEYLDLNVEMEDLLNWSEDSADGGEHMNVQGAQKVTAYLGEYLSAHYDLTDYRTDPDISAEWNEDLEKFKTLTGQ